MVPKGNPMGIRGMADLDGVRLAWRPPGTGSRLLLNRLLLEAGAVPAPEGELCDSHFGVAVAVAVGAVDAGWPFARRPRRSTRTSSRWSGRTSSLR